VPQKELTTLLYFTQAPSLPRMKMIPLLIKEGLGVVDWHVTLTATTPPSSAEEGSHFHG